VRAPAWV